MLKVAIYLTLALNVCNTLAQTGVGVCPDSIHVFQINDLEFNFTIDGIDEGQTVQWDFGNGTILEGTSSVTQLFSEGIFLISATFMDADCPWNGPTVLSVEIIVTPCWLSLSYVQRVEGLFTFTASGNPEVYPMYWEMGDGTQIVETWVVDHIYAPGTYEACCWVVTSFCHDTMSACIEVTIDEVVINTNEHFDGNIELEVNIFPSPVNDMLNIQHTDASKIHAIRICDLTGKVMLEYKGNFQQISTAGWNSGIYIIEFSGEDASVLRKKFIKR